MNVQVLQILAQAQTLHRAGRSAEAAQRYDAVLALDPRHVEALNLLGQLHAEQGDFAAALTLLGRSLKVNPRQPYVLNIEGIMFAQQKKYDDALKSLNRAILLKPDFAEAFLNRGNVRQELHQPAEALANFDAAIAKRPDYADAWTNRGNVLQELQRFADAVASYEKALALKPDADTCSNCGNALAQLKHFDAALARFEQAIAMNPDHAEAHCGKATALSALGRYEDAATAFERAIARRGNYIEAQSALAYLFCGLKRYGEAVMWFNRVLALDEKHPYILGDRLSACMHIAAWDSFDAQCEKILRAIRTGERASSPSAMLAIPADARTLQQCAATYAADIARPPASPDWNGERYAHDRIRIGYYSADFHGHATAYLMAEVLEMHDRARFEIVAFSYGPDKPDPLRERLKRVVDRFIDVRDESDQAIGTLSRREEIDIAVDLKGFSVDNRASIFARRIAPIQVNLLGFPGTLGVRHIDYIIADEVVIPPEHVNAFSEKIAYLPHSYYPKDSRRPIADQTPSRAALGLPEAGFVFCCFNNNYKITPDLFALWIRLLERVPGSVLWLLEDTAAARENLRGHARHHGIAAERLIFAPRLEPADHLARHRRADLFLDTFYCNAHTTASDALWAGLPVLTWLGNTFTSRVAASLLNAIGLPELIAHTHTEYEELALRLATEPALLSSLRRKLAGNRMTQPLFNGALYVRHLEAAYEAMWQRQQRGEAPDHIHVAP
jgi:protein O-GlcNAc transferase